LAQHTRAYPGLNLTRASLAAVLKYPWYRGTNKKYPEKWGAYKSEKKDFEFALELSKHSARKTLEAQIMDWSDDITYSVHDLEDFYRAGRIPLHLLANQKSDLERGSFFDNVFERRGGKEFWRQREALERAFTELLEYFPLERSYRGTRHERAIVREFSSWLIGRYIGGTKLELSADGSCVLGRDENLTLEVAMLKELTWTYVIEAQGLAALQQGQKLVIRTLCEELLKAAENKKNGHIFPPFYRDLLDDSKDDEAKIKRTVVDLVAGMTEDQAKATFARIRGISSSSSMHEILA
jgi:dGTPase